jgi:hypothetical protein
MKRYFPNAYAESEKLIKGDLMLSEFIFSREGILFLDQFKTKFGCRFRHDEPGNDLVFDIGEKTYKIPKEETIEKLKSLILESIKTGKNLLTRQYNVVEYEENADY